MVRAGLIVEFCRSVFCPEPACSRALHLPRSKVLVSQLAHVCFGAVALRGVSVPVFPLHIERKETAFVCPTRVDRRHITPHKHHIMSSHIAWPVVGVGGLYSVHMHLEMFKCYMFVFQLHVLWSWCAFNLGCLAEANVGGLSCNVLPSLFSFCLCPAQS